jgi:hypothetical protein
MLGSVTFAHRVDSAARQVNRSRIKRPAVTVPTPSPPQPLNSYTVPNTRKVCDKFTRVCADLTANTWRAMVTRCKRTDGVWRDR